MWKKDYATLLRAFAKQRGAVLLIAGEGPQEAGLRALARELAVDARFLGRVDDMPALMNAADALVLSSVVEGLPMALLEAAASGLPAVATDAGGVREAILDGHTGFITPPRDPAALAEAMSRLCRPFARGAGAHGPRRPRARRRPLRPQARGGRVGPRLSRTAGEKWNSRHARVGSSL